MALAQSPSDTLDITENPEFSQEVQNRINTVANAAIAVLDKNPDAQRAVKNLFGTMVAENLRDPKLI